jgi:hypothetical protein
MGGNTAGEGHAPFTAAGCWNNAEGWIKIGWWGTGAEGVVVDVSPTSAECSGDIVKQACTGDREPASTVGCICEHRGQSFSLRSR